MLKDIVVNLSSQGPRDFAAEYATSIAAMFGAHITGVSFVYEPVIPDGMLGGVPVDLIELQRQENSKAANDAISRFDAAAKKAGLSAETRLLDATFGGAATRFAQISRRFDLVVVGQAQRERGPADDLLIEGALFEFRSSPRRSPLYPEARNNARTRARVLGRQPHRRASDRRRHAASRARQGGRGRDRRRGTQERGNDWCQYERSILSGTGSRPASSASPRATLRSKTRSCPTPPTAAPISW